MIHELNDENIDAVLDSDRTFLVLFCQEKLPNLPNIMKVFEEFDKQFQGKIDVYKCDVVNQIKINQYFKLSSLPGMVMMKDNTPYANIVGPVSSISYQNAVKQGIIDIMEDTRKKEQLVANYIL